MSKHEPRWKKISLLISNAVLNYTLLKQFSQSTSEVSNKKLKSQENQQKYKPSEIRTKKGEEEVMQIYNDILLAAVFLGFVFV